jgi:uncharacterized protein YecT (DUF1311 family)
MRLKLRNAMAYCCSLIRWYLVAGAIFLASDPRRSALSADFEVDLQRDNCEIRMVGPIAPGDLSKLKSMLPDGYEPGKAGPTMCLNSPGGDFVEGLKIAEFIAEGISTNLQPGAICGSACSWIFMAGTNWSTGGSDLSRSMHATSRLVFHAPYIDPSATSLNIGTNVTSDELIKAAITAYNQATAEIGRGVLSLAKRHTTAGSPVPLIETSLLAEALVKTGKERLEIDTSDKAIRWNINVWGIQNLVPRNKDDVVSVCRNALAHANQFWDWDFLFQTDVAEYIAFYDAEARKLTAQIVLNSITSGACEVELEFNDTFNNVENIQIEANLLWQESVGIHWIKFSREPKAFNFPNYALAKPMTRLSELSHLKILAVDPRSLATVSAPIWCLQQKAKTSDESAVCTNARLAAFDALLDRYFAKLLVNSASGDKQRIQSEQRQWLAERKACADNLECLGRKYHDRIAAVRDLIR